MKSHLMRSIGAVAVLLMAPERPPSKKSVAKFDSGMAVNQKVEGGLNNK